MNLKFRVCCAVLSALLGPVCAFSEAPSLTDFESVVTIRSNLDLGGQSLERLPVLVRVGSHISGFSYGDLSFADGSDLAFFDINGAPLPYEIQQ